VPQAILTLYDDASDEGLPLTAPAPEPVPPVVTTVIDNTEWIAARFRTAIQKVKTQLSRPKKGDGAQKRKRGDRDSDSEEEKRAKKKQHEDDNV
jgi:hypothetical protein